MSKLGDIVAIPIALFALKALTAQVKDEEITPILPEGTNGYETVLPEHDIKPFQIGKVCLAGLPCGPAGGPKPTGAATGLGFGIDYGELIPFFPETAATADEVFPSDGISDITKLKDFEYNIPKSFDPWWRK